MLIQLEPKEIPLLEAYAKLVAAIGITEVTLQKLAKESGVSFSKAQYHFGGQPEELLHKAIQYVGQEGQTFIENYLRQPSKIDNPLHCYINGTFFWAQERPHHAALWSYFYHAAISNKVTRQLHTGFLNAARLRIERMIYECIGREIYPARPNVQQLAIVAHNIIVGSILVGSTDPLQSLKNHGIMACKTVDAAILSFS